MHSQNKKVMKRMVKHTANICVATLHLITARWRNCTDTVVASGGLYQLVDLLGKIFPTRDTTAVMAAEGWWFLGIITSNVD